MKLLRALTFLSTLAVAAPGMAAGNISQPAIAPCPGEFYNVSMPQGATQCQRFDDDMPASLIFHTPQSTESVLQWYQQHMPQLHVASQFNGRVVLTGAQNTIRVVVSPDHSGAQVDLLILDSLLASQ
ncbi:hypothetical protein [Salinimonas sediminis]|uniref:Uncharacterized protein n=1 Tax=Salinimonas sediminis TaxID=2303538 RepID=A0A346NPV4_9ALTE|nr:hypothetical protein [Salinimonas sediminis]AXR07561.1 hypothetical protein D0Y50_15065 [Salinimonas sediminis]